MSVILEISPDLDEAVRQQAAKNGQDVNAFILKAVNEKLTKACSFDEVCTPFAEAVAATGITEDEFDHFFEEARDEVWR